MGRPAPVAAGAATAAALAAAAGLGAALCSACSFLLAGPGRPAAATAPLQRASALGLRAAKKDDKPAPKINEQIRAVEVRLIAELSDDPEVGEMKEKNEVLETREALRRAQERGLDLVLVNEDADPPLVKIVSVGKYVYDEKKRAKEAARNSRAPKPKEVKMTYTIGDHDLNARINQIERWLLNKRQQVRVTVQMKGRTRMFEQQARDLIQRMREEVAAFGKAGGADKTGGTPVSKDGRGDIIMTLVHGPDQRLLKELKERGATIREPTKGLVEDDADDEDEEEAGGSPAAEEAAPVEEELPSDPLARELAEIKREIAAMKQELLDCGIAPGQVSAQPEMIELMARQRQVTQKMGVAKSALGVSPRPRLPAPAALALGLAAGALGAAALGPRRRRAAAAGRGP